MTNGNEWAVEIENLTKSFGYLKALKGLNLKVKKGEFLTLFGPNGAGKTTLVKILATLMKPTGGEVKIDGLDLEEQGESIRKKIGLISHQPYLYDNLTALENLKFYAKMYDLNDDKRLLKIIEEVGLKERKDSLIRTFSRGMQQRLSIARALLHQPEIFLLDEPFTGLDLEAHQFFQDYLQRFKEEGKTVLLTTHNISEGLASATRVAILFQGKLVFQKDASEIELEAFSQTYLEYVSPPKVGG